MIGKSFAPTGQNAQAPQSGGSNVQQAIKVLNLRLPHVAGAGSIAPQPLLTSPGASGMPTPGGYTPGMTPGGAPGGMPPGSSAPPFGLEDALRRLFGQGGDQAPPAPAPTGPPPTAPVPRIVPIQPPAPPVGGPGPRQPGDRPMPPQRPMPRF